MINNDKKLFEYARTIDVSFIPLLSNILDKYELKYINFNDLLNLFIEQNNILLIDSRSEKEYIESHIFNALNFPVLSNLERHNVGLIYKKYSKKAALYLALEYANPKIKSLKRFLTDNLASEKQIIIYCWRGGGRSKYLAKMVYDCGFSPVLVQGGFKSFRKAVFDYFNQEKFPHHLIELTGLTGSGKTELLNSVNNYFPVLDLEDCAKHFSSLFGFIPYKISNIEPVTNQSAFENNIYISIINGINKFGQPKYFLIESESKKIGNFLIPVNLYQEMLSAKCIKIECSLDNRVQRIYQNYFGKNDSGLIEIIKIFKLKERYFRKELSNKIYDYLIIELRKGNTKRFIETMLIDFYDKKYKDKGKQPILILNTDIIEIATEKLSSFLKNTENMLKPS
jgi:tRNA 2-selenouridine synthase